MCVDRTILECSIASIAPVPNEQLWTLLQVVSYKLYKSCGLKANSSCTFLRVRHPAT
jgi:hypothetical protein